MTERSSDNPVACRFSRGIVGLLLALGLLLTAGYASAAPKIIFLIRHAPTATHSPDQDPPFDPRNPPLSDAGQRMAEALAARLKDEAIIGVVSSHLLRTQQTAQPTASQHKLPLSIPGKASSLTAHIEEVAALAEGFDGGSVLIVGHSNTVSRLIRQLGGPALPDLADTAYGDLFILRTSPLISLTQEQLDW